MVLNYPVEGTATSDTAKRQPQIAGALLPPGTRADLCGQACLYPSHEVHHSQADPDPDTVGKQIG